MIRLINKTHGIWPSGRKGIMYEVEVNGASIGFYPLKELVKFVPENINGVKATYDTIYTRIKGKGYKHEDTMKATLTNEERSALCKSNTIKVLTNKRSKKDQVNKLNSISAGVYDSL